MSKKYLSIEEAAAQVGISSAELNRLREKGMIRAFADRGTWKFKEEDVEKLARSRQADSDPEVPLHHEEGDLEFSEDEGLASQPTLISKGGEGSDSDVRLIFDDDLNISSGGPSTPAEDSDSDVKLASPAPAGAPEDDSDSDVKLAGGATPVPAGSDSDVKLVTDELPAKSGSGTGSDSDVRLVSSDSSGEVKLVGSSSSMPVMPVEGGSTILAEPVSGSGIDEESGISLGETSGVKLASDSGISLERPNDSGISLSDESSLVLTDDSGISLDSGKSSSSGISLDAPKSSSIKGDSGISLAAGDSGISLGKQPPSDKKKKKEAKAAADSDDLTGTVPLMEIPLAQDEDLLDTQMEVPSLDDSSGSGDVFGDSGEGEATNVITLDDDEDAGYEVTADIPTRGAAALEDDEEAVTAEEEEPVDVSDELLGEDDELAEDVFGAEDEDFGEEVESGESLSELPVAPRGLVAVEQEWGTGVFSMLAVSTVLLVVCGAVMFDLVRNMWHTDVASHNPLSNVLLDAFKGM